MSVNFILKIYCFLGIHHWEEIYSKKFGGGPGYTRCKNCKKIKK